MNFNFKILNFNIFENLNFEWTSKEWTLSDSLPNLSKRFWPDQKLGQKGHFMWNPLKAYYCTPKPAVQFIENS